MKNVGRKIMIRIRPYKPSDADRVLSWCRDETETYSVLGEEWGCKELALEKA
jgi:hypothetical protein